MSTPTSKHDKIDEHKEMFTLKILFYNYSLLFIFQILIMICLLMFAIQSLSGLSYVLFGFVWFLCLMAYQSLGVI